MAQRVQTDLGREESPKSPSIRQDSLGYTIVTDETPSSRVE